jgi:DNA-binding transcriptional MerR regulator
MAARRSSGYRMFDTSAVERIKLVKQFQELSLSLHEIQGMIFSVAEDNSTCAKESARVKGALRRVEDKIAELAALRNKLRAALERCRAGSCDLVERIRGTSQRRNG